MPRSPGGVDPASVVALGTKLLAQTRLREAAGVFLTAASREGIAAAPIKGLVVSALLYDEPLDRRFGDIDVLVAWRDLGRLEALARRHGWGVVFDSKSFGTLNVVLPPGLPVDARASIGPPGFARVSGEQMLARARMVHDARVTSAPFLLLDGVDHFLILLVDALMDKLFFRAASRRVDLVRAAARWVPDGSAFASRVREAGLATASATVLDWLIAETHDAHVSELRRALEPLPRASAELGRIVRGALDEDVNGWTARIGVRLLADQPLRGVVALALGAAGTARFHLRHRGRDPWLGRLWRGPNRN